MNQREAGGFSEKPPTNLQTAEEMIKKANAGNLTDLERHIFEKYLGMFLLGQDATYNALYMRGTENPPHKLTLSDDDDSELDKAIDNLEKKGVIKIKDLKEE